MNVSRKKLGKDGLQYLIQPKIDGLAISLTYENGKFVRGVTRGNGIEGDDVTRNLWGIDGIPNELQGDNVPAVLEIRGEIFISKGEFLRINEERRKAELPYYANPRNLASGTLKLLDEKIVKSRKMGIRLYGIGACEPMVWKRMSEFNAR